MPLCKRAPVQAAAWTSSISCLYCLTSYVICSADVKTLPGISAPFENIFDPADLIGRADGSVRPVQEIKRWREAEITHSRVAMLAAVGFVIGEQLEVGPATEHVLRSAPTAAMNGIVLLPPPFHDAAFQQELSFGTRIVTGLLILHSPAHRASPPS
jgi:Chlorophyll A-B binding protein